MTYTLETTKWRCGHHGGDVLMPDVRRLAPYRVGSNATTAGATVRTTPESAWTTGTYYCILDTPVLSSHGAPLVGAG